MCPTIRATMGSYFLVGIVISLTGLVSVDRFGLELTFARGLRSILRADPNIVMIGEMRDLETAEIAVRASLTGHLVFSTLHTNDAISSVGRMIDMGAEPYLVASVLEGLLAQRLGRRICSKCAETIAIPEELEHRLTDEERDRFGGRMTLGAGCDECNNSGFRGRLGFFELIRLNGPLRQAIAGNGTVMEMREALGPDFVTMRADGMQKAIAGETTIAEVLRATQDVDEVGS